MAIIHKKEIYPDDTIPSLEDYLLGTNGSPYANKKTQSYPLQGIADLILAYVQEYANGLDQNNTFRFVKSNLFIGGRGADLSTPELKEAAILESIDGFLAATNLTVLEKEIIVFVFNIMEYGVFTTHTRKYLFPNMLGKGIYNPMSATFTAEDLEVVFIDNIFYQTTPEDLGSNINNVVFDLGDITGQDFLIYINTVPNFDYATGYPLTDNTKIYYFKFIDNDVTYMYFFDEENSVNSYGEYGVGGDFTFVSTDLVLFYSSDSVPDPIVLHPVAYSGDYNDLENLPDLSLKLNVADYNDRYKGKYTSLVNLQAAHPTADDGDSAIVDAGVGVPAIEYIWDSNEGWVQGNSVGASNTDGLAEGSTNLYFQTARVLATVLTGISFATGGAIVSTDTVLQAFGKIQKQINDLSTVYQVILTDVNFGAFINARISKTTPVDADQIGLMDSADSDKLKKMSFANLKTALGSPFKKVETASSSNLTGTTATTIMVTNILIPANTFAVGDIIYVEIDLSRTVVTSGNTTVYAAFSPTSSDSVANLTGANKMYIANIIQTTSRYVKIKRGIVIKSGTSEVIGNNLTSQFSDTLATSTKTNNNTDWTVDQYFYILLNNAQMDCTSFVNAYSIDRVRTHI